MTHPSPKHSYRTSRFLFVLVHNPATSKSLFSSCSTWLYQQASRDPYLRHKNNKQSLLRTFDLWGIRSHSSPFITDVNRTSAEGTFISCFPRKALQWVFINSKPILFAPASSFAIHLPELNWNQITRHCVKMAMAAGPNPALHLVSLGPVPSTAAHSFHFVAALTSPRHTNTRNSWWVTLSHLLLAIEWFVPFMF